MRETTSVQIGAWCPNHLAQLRLMVPCLPMSWYLLRACDVREAGGVSAAGASGVDDRVAGMLARLVRAAQHTIV